MSTLDDRSPEVMQRRELLKRAAALLGGAISAPAALAFLQGCSKQEEAASAPSPAGLRFLDAAGLALVAEIAEIMIPRTTTSGAKDAGVPAFIDSALDALYPKEDQERFRLGLAVFDETARGSGSPFLERDAPARSEYVRASLESALAGKREPKPFILMTRELALLGYFSSKVGIEENMEYVAVPTAFHGCVPLSKMNKPVYWEP
jgi:hypothetical protein